MNKIHTAILFLVLIMAVTPVSLVFATTHPSFFVQFEQEPLFREANFLPGQEVVRWVDVTNDASESKVIGVQAKNYTVCSENCLSDQLKLRISNGTNDLYGEVSLTEFFAAGQKKLSDLAGGNTIRYYFTITFVPGAGNNYQNQQVGFDFDIGIFGQETIGGGGTTGSSSGGGGGSGGSFGGDTGLIILNENALQEPQDRVGISWQTNHPATSRVIFSSESEPHNFNLNSPPNYGYAHTTEEISSKVSDHSVIISGLEPGVTYYYRCVSHGSFAVSGEHSFTVPGLSSQPVGDNVDTVTQNEANLGAEENKSISFAAVENNSDFQAGVAQEAGAEEENKNSQEGNQQGSANPFLASFTDLVDFKNMGFCEILFFILIIITILIFLALEKFAKKERQIKRQIFSFIAIIIIAGLYGLVCPNYFIEFIIIEGMLFAVYLFYYYGRNEA